MALITATCPVCGRFYSYEEPGAKDVIKDSKTSLPCLYCYTLDPKWNVGIDWRVDDEETREQLRAIIRDIPRFREGDKYTGDPTIVWPEGGLDFIDSLVDEVRAEREPKDGGRR